MFFTFSELRRSPVLLLGKYFTLLYSVFLAGIHLDTVLTTYVLCSIALEQTLSGEKSQEHKVFLPCFLPTCCLDNYQSFFAPSQQPFPCMADSLHGSGHCAVWILWRISATSLRQLFLDEVDQDSRVQHPPKCRCLGENTFQHR